MWFTVFIWVRRKSRGAVERRVKHSLHRILTSYSYRCFLSIYIIRTNYPSLVRLRQNRTQDSFGLLLQASVIAFRRLTGCQKEAYPVSCLSRAWDFSPKCETAHFAISRNASEQTSPIPESYWHPLCRIGSGNLDTLEAL